MTNRRPFADEGEVIASLNAIRSQIAESDRRHTEDHARIEAQTTKTNGRVNRLEQWRYAAMAVISLLILEAGWAIAVILNMGSTGK